MGFLIVGLGIVLVSANNLMLMVVCLEALSLTSYVMATASRTFGSVTSAVKYFVFGTLGSMIVSWGVVNIYTMNTKLDVIEIWRAANGQELSMTARTDLGWAVSVVVLGLLIKLGAAPFHAWVIDVYSGVSTSTLAFYALVVKMILAFILVKFLAIYESLPIWGIELVAAISLVVGCVGAIRQTQVSRFIAYSSVAQVGFFVVGTSESFVFYVLTYLISLYVFMSG